MAKKETEMVIEHLQVRDMEKQKIIWTTNGRAPFL